MKPELVLLGVSIGSLVTEMSINKQYSLMLPITIILIVALILIFKKK